MPGVVFHELLGFRGSGPTTQVRDAWRRIDDMRKEGHGANLAYGVAAHAPYSVSPELFSEIARQRRSTPVIERSIARRSSASPQPERSSPGNSTRSSWSGWPVSAVR